ncbi:MAG TPA: hypothetical protein VGD35_07520 [Chitinophaga sp.]
MMTHWNYIVTVAAALLLAFLVWKEIKRPNRARLYGRLFASVLAVISLVYLLLPFPLHREQQDVKDKKVSPQADTLPAGIQSVYWQRQINAGADLHLQGRFKNSATTPVKLLLNGFNEHLDSITIPPQEERSFDLNTRPRHIGRALYTLLALAKDTLVSEPIPVEVLPVRPLKVMILAASPDFENKFLANWLSEHDYVVAMRTAISRNKYSYAFLDTARFPLERITPALLTAFDLLVSDAGALSALGRDELGAIRSQVEEKGMGLIIRADSNIAPHQFYNQPFTLTAALDKNERPLLLHSAGADKPVALVTAPAAWLRSVPGLQPLIWDPQQHILAGSSLYGEGRLLLTTLSNTYTWILSGQPAAYQSLWSLLLQQAARQQPLQAHWRTGLSFPKVHQPVPLQLETAQPLPAATVNAASLSLSQDGALPSHWQGVYWPAQSGWQTAVSSQGDSSWWYAFSEKDWQYLSGREEASGRNIIAAQTGNSRRAPLIWFMILFMLSVVFLWAEEKLV